MTEKYTKLEKAMMIIDKELIQTDAGLVEQLEKIINDEQSKPLNEQDTELIEEAVDMILTINNVDMEEIDSAAKEGIARVEKEAEKRLVETENEKRNKKITRPRYLVYLKRVAIVFLSVVTVSFGLLMTNTKVRAAVKNAVVEFFGQFVKINLSNSDNDKGIADIGKTEVHYIPVGFSLDNYDLTPDSKWLFYTDNDGRTINIMIYNSSDTEIDVDNEYTGYEKTEINGYEGYILYDDADQSGTIVFGDKNVTVTVSAIIEKEELINIAKSIREG